MEARDGEINGSNIMCKQCIMEKSNSSRIESGNTTASHVNSRKFHADLKQNNIDRTSMKLMSHLRKFEKWQS